MNSNDRFARRAIDEAIDRAVSDLMELEPRPGLRRRVLSRIGRSAGPWSAWSEGRNALWGRGAFVLLPAAAVLMIVVTVFVSRWRENPVEVAQGSAPLAPSARLAPPTPPAPPALPSRSRPLGRVVPAPRGEALFGPRRDRVSATSLNSTASPEIDEPAPASHDPRSLAVAPIVITPLAQLTELRIAPIEIQRITVPPLFPPR